MFVGKSVDLLQIFRVSTTRGGELFPTQIAALFRKTSAQEHGSLARFAISGAGVAATNQDSNFDSLIGIKSAGDLRAGQHPFVAARNQFAVFHNYLAFFMVSSCRSFIIRRGDVWPRYGVAPGVAAGL